MTHIEIYIGRFLVYTHILHSIGLDVRKFQGRTTL